MTSSQQRASETYLFDSIVGTKINTSGFSENRVVSMNQTVLLSHNAYTMRFADQAKLLDWWPYGHPYRVYLLLLASTGMRTKECDRLQKSNFVSGGVIYKLGKNQRGTRSVVLPDSVWKELHWMFDHYPICETKIWPWKDSGVVTRAICFIRESLGANFLLKRPATGRLSEKYILGLKSFRANYQCLLFWQYFCQAPPIGGSGELAAAFVSAEMHHSGNSFGLTAKHYISGIHYILPDLIQLKQFCRFDPLKLTGQTKLTSFEDQRRLGNF